MDRQKICRLCAEYFSTQELMSLDDINWRIVKIVFQCSQGNSSLDECQSLPRSACEKCIEELHVWWRFIKTVTRAQEKIQVELETDPLAGIKLEKEGHIFASDGADQHLSAFNDVILFPDHTFAVRELSNPSIGQSSRPAKVEPSDFNVIEPKSPTMSHLMEVESLETFDKSKTSSEENSGDGKILNIPGLIYFSESSCDRLFPPEIVSNLIGKSEIQAWEIAMEHFRKILSISDADCNSDGTISETEHPELSQLSWKAYKWKCSICKSHFEETISALESHLGKHHKLTPVEFEYCCLDCDKRFKKAVSLQSHTFQHHRPTLRFW